MLLQNIYSYKQTQKECTLRILVSEIFPEYFIPAKYLLYNSINATNFHTYHINHFLLSCFLEGLSADCEHALFHPTDLPEDCVACVCRRYVHTIIVIARTFI